MTVRARQFKALVATRLAVLVVVGIALLGGPITTVAAAWPLPRLEESAWPTSTGSLFAFHIEPDRDRNTVVSANAFRIEHEPAFDAAALLANAVLASDLTGPIDVFAYQSAGPFGLALNQVNPARTPHRTVFLDRGRNALILSLPGFLALSDVQAEDEIRNAVAQLAIRVSTSGHAPPAFGAGFSLYLELPTPEVRAKMAALVQQADKDDVLIPWFDLNRSSSGTNSNLVLAESYAMIAFLIDRYDIPAVRTFLTSVGPNQSWQDAMRTAFGNDSATIEQQWRSDLPRWTTSGWRDNLMASFDLQPARDLLGKGQYVAAKAVLDPSLNLYRQLGDASALGDVQTLMAQADTGIQAETLMIEVEAALVVHDYIRATNLLDQADIQYRTLTPDQVPTALLSAYRTRATDGITAISQLADADRLADSWGSYPEARAAARSAGETFAQLGDQTRAAEAQRVIERLDNRQRRLVGLLGSLGLVVLIWLGLWLRARGPAELQWRPA